jgi:hypothetical protein
MPLVLRALGLLGCLGAAGCDPGFGLRVRQPLAPSPSADCVQTALEASPRVAQVSRQRRRHRDYYDLVLRDTIPIPWAQGPYVVREPPGESMSYLAVGFSWMGGFHPGSVAQERQLHAIAADLLRAVRERCAPASGTPVECALTTSMPGVKRQACSPPA